MTHMKQKEDRVQEEYRTIKRLMIGKTERLIKANQCTYGKKFVDTDIKFSIKKYNFLLFVCV